MATYLYRLGGWAFEHRRAVVAIWAPVLVARGRRAVAFGGKTNDKFSVPGTESQQAQELLEQKFPAASGAYARIVFAAPEGETLTDPENKAAVEAALAQARRRRTSRRSATRTRPRRSPNDGRVGFADVIYPVPAPRSTTRPAISSRRRRAGRGGRPAGRVRRRPRHRGDARPARRASA